MYKIGFDKKNIFIFSKKSAAFLLLLDVFNKINYTRTKDFLSNRTVTISNDCEIKLIILYIKVQIISDCNHLYYLTLDDTSYINFLKLYKKNIAHLRDPKYSKIRSYIKLYMTLFLLYSKLNEITISTYNPNEHNILNYVSLNS